MYRPLTQESALACVRRYAQDLAKENDTREGDTDEFFSEEASSNRNSELRNNSKAFETALDIELHSEGGGISEEPNLIDSAQLRKSRSRPSSNKHFRVHHLEMP